MQNQTTLSPLRCNPLLYGSLFSGIGGIDLGFDRAGLKCAWQVEIDPFARKVLEKHWPGVPKHDDIRTFKPTPVDVVAGGFPCQDISSARTGDARRGLDGDKSGLWSEYINVIRNVRPRIVVIENVADLTIWGLDRVLCDLAGIGFDAGWRVFCSSEFGFPYMRRRLFVVACTNGDSKPARSIHAKVANMPKVARDSWERSLREVAGTPRVVDGVSNRVQRCTGLGNAVVPAIAEWVGRRLIESV